MKGTYKIEKYTDENLLNIMCEASPFSSKEVLKGKLQFDYFKEYFSDRGISVKTILVEYNYVDHDYLEDYQAYYVRCFEKYERYTVRLHFFSNAISTRTFNSILASSPKDDTAETKFKNSYCGFIVIKPLAQTIIGRTCLKTYPDKFDRKYTVLRAYNVSLFGLSLTVNSLAFQEQDRVVSACATSALWSCFQATGKLFQHAIPSPVVITKEATTEPIGDTLSTEVRAFPNKGLVFSQMDLAIRGRGLEAFVISVSGNRNELNRLIYAYLRCKIPLLLMCNLHSKKAQDPLGSSEGAHAVAVTGYNLLKKRSSQGDCCIVVADRIDKLFVHDDRVGPFARMLWENIKNQGGNNQQECLSVNSFDGTKNVARPTMVILPLYHKIRIPFGHIYDAVSSLDGLLSAAWQAADRATMKIEWDIYLTTVSDFKASERLNHDLLGREQLLEILSAPLPKYLWRVLAYKNNPSADYLFELLFDATGVAQGSLLVATPMAVDSSDARKVISIISSLKPNENMNVLTSEIVRFFGCQS